MKFDQRTLTILKNFSEINQAIVINPGDEIKTISPAKSIMAIAKVSQVFETQVGIWDLSRFLGALSLFKEPEIVFQNKYMTIKSGERELNYTFSEPANILQPKKFKLPKLIASFELSTTMIQDIIKSLSVLELPEIGIIGQNGTISIQALDVSNPTGDSFKIANVGSTDKEFRFIFKPENLKIISGDYTVDVTEGVAHFKGNNLEYMIVAEATKSKLN